MVIGRPIESELGGSDSSKEYRKAESLLQALSRDLCLRRLKHMSFVDLKLPEKTERIFDVEFSKDEKVKYDAMLYVRQTLVPNPHILTTFKVHKPRACCKSTRRGLNTVRR